MLFYIKNNPYKANTMSTEKPIKNAPSQVRLYPADIFEKLEFNKITDLLIQKCKSTLGIERVKKIQVIADKDLIEKYLQQSMEFKQILMFEENQLPESNYISLKEELHLLSIPNAALNEIQIFNIYKVLKTIELILNYFGAADSDRRKNYPELAALTANIEFNKAALHQIKTIIDEEGKVRNDASPELASIRRSITAQYRDLERKFNATLAEYRRLGYLSDMNESVRSGRRVLAVAAEHKRKVRGLMHDESNSGSICFIEPEAVLDINNQIFELQQAEKREIFKILKKLTAFLHPFTHEFQKHQTLLSQLDFIRAKALLACDLNAFKPIINTEKRLEIWNARHPLLFLRNKAQNKKTIPLNFELSIANRILLVSGPNAGGKSVMLKTVGLLQIMLQAGIPIPITDHSITTIFNDIFVDIGDEQSIENDLSTYSSHLKNMQHFTHFASSKSLILIDEFGAGTDPALGGAIAESILEHFVKQFSFGVITTHYSNLKVFATQTKGILNACMTFDYQHLTPLYTLEVGNPGSSFAFELAEKSKLSPQIIANAQRKLNTQYKEFDELLVNLQKQKQEVTLLNTENTQKQNELNLLIENYTAQKTDFDKKRKTLFLEAQQKALEIVENANRQYENMMKTLKLLEQKREQEIKTLQNAQVKKIIPTTPIVENNNIPQFETELTEIKNFKIELDSEKKQLNENITTLKEVLYKIVPTAEIAVGSFVRLRTNKEVGKIIELKGNNAVVEFGALRTKVKTNELLVVELAEVPTHKAVTPTHNNYNVIKQRSEFQGSLDVRGKRREETLLLVENFVNDALMLNIDEIKIIHGLGDGILKKSIRELLKRHKHVQNYKDEEAQYGGSGVTLIELK